MEPNTFTSMNIVQFKMELIEGLVGKKWMIFLILIQKCHIVRRTLKATCNHGVHTAHCFQDKEGLAIKVQDVEFHCALLAMEKWKMTVSLEPMNPKMRSFSFA
jgi:hypothetical protein